MHSAHATGLTNACVLPCNAEAGDVDPEERELASAAIDCTGESLHPRTGTAVFRAADKSLGRRLGRWLAFMPEEEVNGKLEN
mmetsp:Transcript_42756/g.112503  ORF Transcript_42756/g.112503 Transcript_42756/m.112503 type:complete len:82 (-) Transcript_42756:917-1162(-)